MENWLDKYGMIHTDPQPCGGTNGMLFTCEYLIYKAFFYRDCSRVDSARSVEELDYFHRRLDGTYMQTPVSCRDMASHDNNTAMLSACKYFRINSVLESFDILENKIYHPRDIFYYLYLKGGPKKFLSYFGLWITFLAQIVSCYQWKKVRIENDEKRIFVATDGKRLAFLRCISNYDSWVWRVHLKLLTFIIKRHTNRNGVDISTWSKIQRHYFKNQDHPIIKLTERLENAKNV